MDVTFEFSTKYLAGSTIVIFEDLYYPVADENDVLVFSHHDINEKAQTIYVGEREEKIEITTEKKTESKIEKKVNKPKTVKKSKSPNTGDDVPVIPIIADMLLMVGGIVMIINRKKKK